MFAAPRGSSLAVRALIALGIVATLVVALLPFRPPAAHADPEDLPSPEEGCLDSVAGAVGLFDGVQTPAGGIQLDVPGPVVRVIVEWMGRDDADTGQSDLGVEVTGPSGTMDDPALPGTLASSTNTRADGTGRNFYAWWGDITHLFGDGEPGTYDIDLTPFATPGQGVSWGATVTVVYDTTPCGEISQILWKIGADYYFGGNASSPKTTHLIVYDFDEPLDEDLETTVRSSHGGADHTTGACRASNIWMATGDGPAPSIDDDLVDASGNPTHAGAVEAVNDPFAAPSQSCPPPSTTEPATGVEGGHVGPQYALIDIDVTIPEGSSWMAFQLESPADNNGNPGLPESGSWGGGGILVIPASTPPDPDVVVEKTVLDGHGAACPGTEGTDEQVTATPGSPVTYCFRVVNTGTTPLFPVAVDDPDLGISEGDMTLVSGDDTTPLLIGGELVYSYETTVDTDLVNVATVTGTPSDPAGDPLPDLDPVTDSNDATVDALAPGIAIEKTVLPDHHDACPGVQGDDELVAEVAGAPVTYCFLVENVGDVPLDPVTIDDPDLGIDHTDMDLVSGDDTVPLAPGATLVYAHQSTIDTDLVNVATATGTPVDPQGDPLPDEDPVTAEDDAAVEALEPSILLEKTVLEGAGGDCPGVEGVDELATGRQGAEVTYCFRVTNTGETELDPVTIDDPDLGIDHTDMDLVSGDDAVPLAPGATLVYAHQSTIDTDLVNVATATGTPVPADPVLFPADLAPVTSTNDAAVEIVAPGIELEKTVLAGHDVGCPGVEGTDEQVSGETGDPITYCFRVVNTGNTPLFPVTLDDDPLGVTGADMDLVTGDDTAPLMPGEELVYAHETTIMHNLVNVAVVTGTPSDPEGEPLEPVSDLTDDNDAAVIVEATTDPAGDDDDDGGPTLPLTGTAAIDHVLLGLGLVSLGGGAILLDRLVGRRARSTS